MKGRVGLYTEIFKETEKHQKLFGECDNEVSGKFEILRHEVALRNILDSYGIECIPKGTPIEPIDIKKFMEEQREKDSKSNQIQFDNEYERQEAIKQYERKYNQNLKEKYAEMEMEY